MSRNPTFQSSRSLRTATRAALASSTADTISILAVLADRDNPSQTTELQNYNFNPRGPCGPRPASTATRMRSSPFQSSRSLRTATALPTGRKAVWRISILAVLADRDVMGLLLISVLWISILAVLADRDLAGYRTGTRQLRFQSSRSLRTATAKTHKRSAASLYKAENILSAPKSFLREGRKNQRLPSPSPCVFRCEPARERPGAWPSH